MSTGVINSPQGVEENVQDVAIQDVQLTLQAKYISLSTNVTDGRTDRQTTCNRKTALCNIVHLAIKALIGEILTSSLSFYNIPADETDKVAGVDVNCSANVASTLTSSSSMYKSVSASSGVVKFSNLSVGIADVEFVLYGESVPIVLKTFRMASVIVVFMAVVNSLSLS